MRPQWGKKRIAALVLVAFFATTQTATALESQQVKAAPFSSFQAIDKQNKALVGGATGLSLGSLQQAFFEKAPKEQLKPVYLIGVSSTHAVTQERMEREFFDTRGLVQGPEARESRRYRNDVEKLLLNKEELILSVYNQIKLLSNILETSYPRVEAFGFAEPQARTDAMVGKDISKTLNALTELMKMRGLEDVDQKAHDALYLLEGIRAYILGSPEVNREAFDFYGVESNRLREQGFQLKEKALRHAVMLQKSIHEDAPTRSVNERAFYRARQFTRSSYDGLRVPSRLEKKLILEQFEGKAVKKEAAKWLGKHTALIKNTKKRNDARLKAINRVDKTMVLFIENSRLETLQKAILDSGRPSVVLG